MWHMHMVLWQKYDDLQNMLYCTLPIMQDYIFPSLPLPVQCPVMDGGGFNTNNNKRKDYFFLIKGSCCSWTRWIITLRFRDWNGPKVTIIDWVLLYFPSARRSSTSTLTDGSVWPTAAPLRVTVSPDTGHHYTLSCITYGYNQVHSGVEWGGCSELLPHSQGCQLHLVKCGHFVRLLSSRWHSY